jgi:hypothetical protein
MISECSFIPESIWVRESSNGIRHITLRRNVTEEIKISEGIEEKVYTFEETDVHIVDRDKLEDFVNENFGNLFDLGLQQTEEKTIKEEKIQKTKQGIETGQITDDIQILGQQITNLMLEVL